MGRSLRQVSTQCGKCDVVFDLEHPKQPKRALCIVCYQIELDNRNTLHKEKRAEVGAALNRIELYRDYKVENRKPIWEEINKQIRPLTKRVEIRAFISKQMDRILEDTQLMQYISLVSIAEQRKNEKQK
jgi:hypothetical protein